MWLAAVAILAAFVIHRWAKGYFSTLRSMPEPPGWPVLRHTVEYLLAKDRFALLAKWCRMFREEGIFKVDFARVETSGYGVFTCKPEYIKQVLNSPSKFVRPPYFKTFFPLCGDGLLTAAGLEHTKQRKLLAKAFSPTYLQALIPSMDKHAARMVKYLESKIQDVPTGCNVGVQTPFSDLAFDILCDCSFGYSFDTSLTMSSKVRQAIKDQVNVVGSLYTILLLYYFPFLLSFPFGPGNESKKKQTFVRKTIDEIIREKKTSAQQKTDGLGQENDLLSLMLSAKDIDGKDVMGDLVIRDNIFIFMLAGFESTGAAFAWLLYALAMHPAEQEKCREEIMSVTGDAENLTADIVSEMKYLSAFIKEALRVYTIIPYEARESASEQKLGKYTIPKGVYVYCVTSGLHDQEDLYPNPEEFKPSRFLNGVLPPASMQTFGYGPYNCIGEHFAMQEFRVVLARVLMKFKLSADAEFQKYNRTYVFTSVAQPPVTVRFQAWHQ